MTDVPVAINDRAMRRRKSGCPLSQFQEHLAAVTRTEPRVDRCEPIPHRLLGDIQLFSYVLVAKAPGNQPNDIPLPRSEHGMIDAYRFVSRQLADEQIVQHRRDQAQRVQLSFHSCIDKGRQLYANHLFFNLSYL